MRVGAWGPGYLQSSAASLRRLGRAGSEDSCSGPGGDVRIPGGRFGQLIFQSPFMPQLGHGPGGGLGFRHEWAQWPSLPSLKQGQVTSFLCWLMEAWSHVGQQLNGGIWPDLVGPSLALSVLPSY